MIKALGNRIFLKKDLKTQDSCEIIDNLQAQKNGFLYAPPYSGTIISVGSRVEDIDYIVGARVLFHDLAGVEIDLDDSSIVSIREQDVTAIIFDETIKIN